MRWSGWVWGTDVPPARYFANMPYIPLAVGLPAITATVTSGNGVGFHFKVSRGMIVGAAASWAAAAAAIAVDMRQATETAASLVRYAIASSSRVMLSNLPSKNMVQVLHSPARRECTPSQARRISIQPMSAPGLVSRASPVHTVVRNCTRDEGGPFGFGDQVADPKPPRAAAVKSRGG